MIKKIVVFVFSLSSIISFSQEKKSLLWEISGNGMKTSYIFGTFHMLCPSDYKILNKVEKAFEKSTAIVLEADINDMGAMMEMQKEIMKIEKPLTDFIPDDQEEKIDDFLKTKLGVSLAMYNKMKPAAISMSLISLYMPCSMLEIKSYEKDFYTMAKSKNKKLIYFETLLEQWKALDVLPDQEEVNQLIETIHSFEDGKHNFTKMLEVYLSEDLDALAKLMEKEIKSEKQLETLLYKRNENWIPKIEKLLQEEQVFIAVGAGHLPGKRGVLNLLKKKGFKIKPVLD